MNASIGSRTSFVSMLVRREPLAIVVAAQLFEELEKLWSEVPLRHRPRFTPG